MWKKLFKMQKQLDVRVQDNPGFGKSLEEKLYNLTCAMEGEINEIREALAYLPQSVEKWWKDKGTVNMDKLKEEHIDLFHFWLSFCLTAGWSPEEMFNAYVEKNRVNHERQSIPELGYVSNDT